MNIEHQAEAWAQANVPNQENFSTTVARARAAEAYIAGAARGADALRVLRTLCDMPDVEWCERTEASNLIRAVLRVADSAELVQK